MSAMPSAPVIFVSSAIAGMAWPRARPSERRAKMPLFCIAVNGLSSGTRDVLNGCSTGGIDVGPLLRWPGRFEG